MKKRCKYCREEYETEKVGSAAVCPKCGRSQVWIAAGCSVMVLFGVVAYVIGMVVR